MVEQATLSLSIDASEAKRGAAEFSRAADDIKRKAAEMGRALDRSSQAFRGMQAAANDNSRALNSSVRSLRDAESVLRGLGDAAASTRDRMWELQSSSDQACRSLFDKFGKEIRGFSDLIIELGVELGVSASTMSIVVTAIEGVAAAIALVHVLRWLLQLSVGQS